VCGTDCEGGIVITRKELRKFILDTYNATTDSPWIRYPNNEVFRHPENQKWFALMMDVPASVFSSTEGKRLITIINVKCNPILSGSLRQESGIHPAYHMNKDQWISVEIEDVPEEKIKWLIEMSFIATEKKATNKRKFPEALLFEMAEPYLTVNEDDKIRYGKEWTQLALHAQEAAHHLNTSDIALADHLLALIKSPIQEILRKYYKENMTCATIGTEYGVTAARISELKRKGLRIMRNRWVCHGCPLTVDEFQEFILAKEKEVTPESNIGVLQPTVRILNALYRSGRETIADLLELEDPSSIRNLGPKGCADIAELKKEAVRILRKNGYEVD